MNDCPMDTEWNAFLKECSNPKIGVLNAIERQSLGAETILDCWYCKGKGKVWEPDPDSDWEKDNWLPCDFCDGTGYDPREFRTQPAAKEKP